MKLYVDGDKKKKPATEIVEENNETTLKPNGKGSFKPIKIYVNGAENKPSETWDTSGGMSGGGWDPHGQEGFHFVVSDDAATKTRRDRIPTPEPEEEDIPVVTDDKKRGKDVGKNKILIALLAAACVFVIVWALSRPRQPEVIVETVPQVVVVKETVAPVKAFSDDPAAIQAASESVVIIYVCDMYGDAVGSGSGFACFENDILVTNYHVADGAAYLLAVTEDGQKFEIDMQRSYGIELMDVAILRTNVPHNLPLLQLGDSTNMLKGEKVVAIGSPDGLMNSVSDGVFSRYDLDGLIQMTATIWHGSSGGALFNDRGEVIGITSGGLEGQGINFAVPIEWAIQLYHEVKG